MKTVILTDLEVESIILALDKRIDYLQDLFKNERDTILKELTKEYQQLHRKMLETKSTEWNTWTKWNAKDQAVNGVGLQEKPTRYLVQNANNTYDKMRYLRKNSWKNLQHKPNNKRLFEMQKKNKKNEQEMDWKKMTCKHKKARERMKAIKWVNWQTFGGKHRNCRNNFLHNKAFVDGMAKTYILCLTQPLKKWLRKQKKGS